MEIIMNQNKFFSSVIALLLIAFFTTSWVFPTPAAKKGPIIINSVYDLGGPYPFQGTFYTHGALEIEGTVTMEVDVNPNATRFHCLYTFAGPEGTIIIREECIFATPVQGQGRWEIVSGTGAYAHLKGNGSALMPGNEENWVGVIY
jgi:hypothetical protein